MKNKMKQLVSLILAVLMTFSFALPSFADDTSVVIVPAPPPSTSTTSDEGAGGGTEIADDTVNYDTITVDGTSFQSNENASGTGWYYEWDERGYGALYLDGYNGGAISSTGRLRIFVEAQTKNTVTSGTGNAISAFDMYIYSGWNASLSVNGAEDGIHAERVYIDARTFFHSPYRGTAMASILILVAL